MSTKISCRLRIALVKELANKPVSTMTFFGPTLEHVGLMAINILDCWHWLEEHIDRCVPLLALLL
jgi:hypothetical protein